MLSFVFIHLFVWCFLLLPVEQISVCTSVRAEYVISCLKRKRNEVKEFSI